MIAVAVLGAVMLVATLKLGWHWYPILGRVYRNGPDPSMYWFALFCELILIVSGLAFHFFG